MSLHVFHGVWIIQVALWFVLLQIASQTNDQQTTETPLPIRSIQERDLGKKNAKRRNLDKGGTAWPYVLSTTPSYGIMPLSDNKNEHVFDDGEEKPKTSAVIPGNIMLGGLFPVHKKGRSQACGEIQADRGVQRLEAMLFAIDTINRDKSILKDVTLGATIMDTCSRDTYALEQSLEYVRASLSSLDASMFKCTDGSPAVATNTPVPVAGVIGGSYSTVSIQVANLFRLFKIPQISYASTSAALSDKTRFDYFARTVPPDNFQAKAIADIVLSFNWTYVSTVASEGNYGEMGIESFKYEANLRNICIAEYRKVVQSARREDFDDIIDALYKEEMARVVILFLRVEDATNLLLASKRRNKTNHFVWIASDGWGSQDMPVRDKEQVAEGALTIELQSTSLAPFDRYFMSLTPANTARNPWFNEYWERVFSCKLSDGDVDKSENITYCTGNERISTSFYKQETKIQFVYDAVYAMAHALDNMFSDHCGKFRGRRNRKRCILDMRIDGESLFYNYLLNVSFNDGYGAHVAFDSQGDGKGRYDVLNYRRNRRTRQYEYVKVGHWNSGLRMSPDRQIRWAGGTLTLPRSECSLPCGPGQVRHEDSHTCCWVCITCQPWQYVQGEFTCLDCETGWWPTDDKTSCFRLHEHYMDWTTIYAIMPVCLSLLGFLLTSIVMLTFVRHINTPIVKATGRELSFMLLAGFMICFAMTFILLLKPSPIVCGVQRFGVGFGFSVTYSSLLTKTNRISRIFDSASRSAKRPPFISPRSQVVITMLFISVQVICNCVWLVLEPPGTRHFLPFGKRDEIVLKCRIRDESFLISLVYNMLLIIVCTVYAVKTRKIPENFNESKFIGFTMYTTCIIWLAFVPIYFGTLNSFQIQVTTLCASISLSAFVGLLCLFTPKMYIIVFQPEKNVRRLTMNSGTYKKPSSSMSVINSNHGPASEHIKLNSQLTPLRLGGTTTETETDRDQDLDSLASLSDHPDAIHAE